MYISLVIASRGDREELKKATDAASDADEIIVVVDKPRKEQVFRVNEGVAKAKGDVIMVMPDRIILKEGWRQALEDNFKRINNSGCVTFERNFCGTAAVTRDFLEGALGGYFCWPDYLHYNWDLELGDRARKLLKYCEVPDCEKYYDRIPKQNLSQSNDVVDYDLLVYRERTNLGWPNERIRTEKDKEAVLKSQS